MEQLERLFLQNQQVITDLQQRLEEAQAAAQTARVGAGTATSSFIDTRVLGKPESFEGNEAKWPDWSVVVRAYMSLVNTRLGTLLPAAELEANVEALNNERLAEPLDVQASIQAYYILLMLCKGTPLNILINSGHEQGLRGWRA